MSLPLRGEVYIQGWSLYSGVKFIFRGEVYIQGWSLYSGVKFIFRGEVGPQGCTFLIQRGNVHLFVQPRALGRHTLLFRIMKGWTEGIISPWITLPLWDKVHPLGTKFTHWGQSSSLGDKVHPLGTKFIHWGLSSSLVDNVHPLWTMFIPCEQCSSIGD
jgi:hypothetical protein